jgi:hypothetical protein
MGADLLQGSAVGKIASTPVPAVEGLAKVRSVRQVEEAAADLATLHATFPAPACGRISRVAQHLVLARAQQEAGPSIMNGEGKSGNHGAGVGGGMGHVDAEVADGLKGSDEAVTPRDQVIASFDRRCAYRP